MSEAKVNALLERLGVLDITITSESIQPYLVTHGDKLLHASDGQPIRQAILWLLLAVYRTYGADSGIVSVGQEIGIDLTNARTIEESFMGTSGIPMEIVADIITLDTLLVFQGIVEVWVYEADELEEGYLLALNSTIVVLHDLWWARTKKVLVEE